MINEIEKVEKLEIVTGDIGRMINEFIDSLDVKDKSKETYRKATGEFFKWLNQQRITNPDRQDILNYKNYLIGKHLSPATVTVYITSVRRFFAYLEGLKAYPDIAKGIKGMKKSNNKKKDTLTSEQILRLLNSINKTTPAGTRDYAIINLMLRTGIRGIEVYRADIGDIGVESGKTVLRVWGKGRDSKDDYVILTTDSYNPIMDYLKTREPYKKEEPMFISNSDRSKGERLATVSLRKIITDRLKAAGLKTNRVTAHSFRHTAGTIALMNGADIVSVKDMLRHSDINTTMIYVHNLKRVENPAEEYIKF